MKLHYKKLGEGVPLLVLHGVFGSSDNLFTVCKSISEQGFEVYVVDARNHGRSPRSHIFNYDAMAADLNELLDDLNLQKPALLGHSMGGKTVLHFSQHFENFSKLIVVDITAKAYPPHHQHIISGLLAIPLDKITSRKEAEDIFKEYVADFGERQFLLKNLYRTDEGKFDWRINVPVIAQNAEKVVGEIALNKIVENPLLIMRGAESRYVSDKSIEQMKSIYPHLKVETIAGANHWVHAMQPVVFVKTVVDFLNG